MRETTQIKIALNALNSAFCFLPSDSMTGIYIHIPFCSAKCHYCSFVSFAAGKETIDRYLKALAVEMGNFAGTRAETLYIGGGTPGFMSAAQIKTLLLAVEKNFQLVREFLESTFEANPESLTRDKMMALKQFGVNRISLGLAAVQESLLKSLGRRHTFSDFSGVYRDLRSLGFSNISVDLLIGIPGQTVLHLKETLDKICAFNPEHVSVYGLEIEEKTVFWKKGVAVDGDLAREMFEITRDRLEAAGYRHYEISNFAKPCMESRHNLNYWDNGEYVGLGCGATSYLCGARRTNPSTLGLYGAPLLAGMTPGFSSCEVLSEKEKIGETIMLGLRKMSGISLSPGMKREFGDQLLKLAAMGLIELKDESARLTRDGVYVSNIVFREFVPPFD